MIRKAEKKDLSRIAEIQIFNYRLYYYPIFRSDEYYFDELQVPFLMNDYESELDSLYVYDDGVVKGFIKIEGTYIARLFVEPVLQNASIGSQLLEYAVKEHHADHLWALEKNTKAIRFYERHGFAVTEEKKLEEDTTEYLVLLRKKTRKTMDLHDCFELEDMFPKSFTDFEERSYGILFYNTQNKDSYDSNHAVIFRDRIQNITTVLKDIVDFYREKELTPMIYQSALDKGYFPEIAKELSEAGFESRTEEQRFMVLAGENTIVPNKNLTVRRMSCWDRSFEQIFEEAGEPWETEVARRSLDDPNTVLWVAYLGEKPIGILYCITAGNVCRGNYVLVSKLHRNVGAGRTLTYCFVEWCRENGIQKVFLWPDGEHPEKIYFEGGFRYEDTLNAGRAVYRG